MPGRSTQSLGVMTENEKLRWVLILPSAVVAWFAALLVGMLALSLAEHLCPPENVVSGTCDVVVGLPRTHH